MAEIGIKARMENAIRKLIPKSLPQETLNYLESALPVAVHALLVEGGSGARIKPIDDAKMSNELKRVEKAAAKLLEAMDDLHPHSAKRFKNLLYLKIQVNTIKIVSGFFASGNGEPEEELSDDEMKLSPPEALAYTAGLVFLQMTTDKKLAISHKTRPDDRGAHKSVSGEFPDFLSEVFAIRGIKASVEVTAEKARDVLNRHNQGEKNPKNP